MSSVGPSLSGPVVDQKKHNKISLVQKMLAACSGSLLTSIVVTPFDVVRVRMQQQSAFPYEPVAETTTSPQKSAAVASKLQPRINTLNALKAAKVFPVTEIPSGVGVTKCCRDVFWFPSSIDYCVASELATQQSCAVKDSRFHGTWDALRKISGAEGISALWRGLSLTLVMSIPSNVVYFIAYEQMRDSSPIQEYEVLNPLLCGGLARSLAASVISPFELIKTRLQSARGEHAFRNTLTGVKDMVVNQGAGSLWRGLVLTLWRDVPFSGIYWVCVEAVRKQLAKTRYFDDVENPNHTLVPAFIAGSVGGAVAAFITTPFDVGKTRRQIGHHQCSSSAMGMIPFMVRIYQTEGLSALFVGLTPRILKVAPACAIMISSYEMGKRLFHQKNDSQANNITQKQRI